MKKISEKISTIIFGDNSVKILTKKITGELEKSIKRKGILLFFLELFIKYTVHFIYRNNFDGPIFPCKIKNTELKVVSCNEEFNSLLNSGFDFSSFSSYQQDYEQRLEKGAILFCLLVGQKMAHVSWVGLEKNASRDFYNFPSSVDSTAYIGGTITAPEYRRKGINLYIHSEIFQYLKKKGKSKALLAILRENIAARNSQIKLQSYIIEERHELRLLFLLNFRWVRIRAI